LITTQTDENWPTRVGEILGSGKPFCGRHIDWQVNVKLWNDLLGWAGANAAALRLCFRMTVAGLLAYVLAELFTLPRGYWAVFSAIIIVQASVGGSVKATIDRVIGTIGGAVAGGALGYLLPHETVLLLSLGVALVIALVLLTFVAALRPNYRIAPLTAVIVLLTSGAQQLGPLESALYRIFEITLGSFVGLGISLVLLPARAHELVISAATGLIGHIADLLGDWLAVLAGAGDRTRIMQLQDDIRGGMVRLEIAAGEARQEQRTYLSHEFDPDPLVRTVFRLRNDLVMIGRAAAEPLPGPILARLHQPLEQASQAAQRFLRTCADTLRERKNPPALDAVEQAFAKFITTIEELRREGATQASPAENIGRLYAFGFALEQLRQNFIDFRSRVSECARADRKA
jgi:uncharacterized membrane protein YccC